MLRILIVEDDLDLTLILSELLTEAGYECASAHDGPAALVLAKAFCPDIALIDFGLPTGGMDGREVAQVFRRNASVPFLVGLSGWPIDQTRHYCAAIFDRMMAKPLRLSVLLAVLEEK